MKNIIVPLTQNNILASQNKEACIVKMDTKLNNIDILSFGEESPVPIDGRALWRDAGYSSYNEYWEHYRTLSDDDGVYVGILIFA